MDLSRRGLVDSCWFCRPVVQIVLVVKKTTGGKAWLPKWGFKGLTRGQKANKNKQRKEEQAVIGALKQGAAGEVVKQG